MQTIVSLWWKNMHGYLSSDTTCFRCKQFSKSKAWRKCEAWGTDNVQGLINEHIFALYRGYCVSYPSNTVASHGKNIYEQLTVYYARC